MSRIDALTSSTLKHLRERWWDDDFTEFLRETLLPLAGNRILDVGCGVGTAELRLGKLSISQVRLFGVDLILARAREAVAAVAAHNVRARFVVGDACKLPFGNDVFDSTFCVAVLQHVRDLSAAVQELVRVTRPGGRVLAVEPDNAARYWYSSIEVGADACELAARFFTVVEGRGDGADLAVGPKLSEIFARHGVEPTAVRLFPVSVARLGPPAPALWAERRQAARGAIDRAPNETVRQLGVEYLRVLERYAEAAAGAGRGFVEIQNTMLFATVGHKPAT